MFKFFKNNKAFTRINPPAGGLDGFTLVELIVVIALIAILALIIFIIIDPTKMKQKANDGKVRTDVSQIAGTLAQYMGDYNIKTTSGWKLIDPYIPASYFQNNTYPVHPCFGAGRYWVKADYSTNSFLACGQLCSDMTKAYDSNGSIITADCR